MLKYDFSVSNSRNEVYSIDMLTVDIKLSFYAVQGVLDWISFCPHEFNHWQSFKVGTFVEQFTFDCGEGRSFWVGIGLRDGNGVNGQRARIEFNPNKTRNTVELVEVFNQLVCSGKIEIRKFDLAIDVPIERKNCFLVVDNKHVYEEYRIGYSNRTQYQGQRSVHGRCKLYNKQAESGTNHPLTRLEMTVDYHKRLGIKDVFPVVLVIDDLQMCFGDEPLTPLDRYVILTLFDNPENIGLLDKRYKKKIQRVIDNYAVPLKLDIELYNDILAQLESYMQPLDGKFVLSPFSGYFEKVDKM